MKKGYSGADTLGEREVRALTAQTLELESNASALGLLAAWAIPVCGTCLGSRTQASVAPACQYARTFIHLQLQLKQQISRWKDAA